MKQINSYGELSKLIFLSLKKGVNTNCFISKKQFEMEICNKTLYYISLCEGLIILRDRKEYYILNYYFNNVNLDELKVVFERLINKKIVIEIVDKSNKDENYRTTIELFEQLGLERALERERFTKKTNIQNISDNINEKNDRNVENGDFFIEFCKKHDYDFVQNILSTNFNKYYGCIPSRDMIIEDINSNNFYKASLNNKIVGILHVQKTEKSAEIRHLVVDKDFRNKGIASELLKKFDNDVNTIRTVWTGKDNKSGQKVYAKNGYEKDGYISTVLINS